MITCKILADSVNPIGSRLTSFLITYPRFIHSEFMTHRVFSRNAASSRAIPFPKLTEQVLEAPAMPERLGCEQRGMKSGELIKEIKYGEYSIRQLGIKVVTEMERIKFECDLHKSIANRYIEPWLHITVLATATDKGLSNFFALRAHPDAQPEFQVLAYRMLNLYIASEGYLNTKQLKWGEWHIPSFTDKEWVGQEDERIKVATARCARLSYLTHDGEYSIQKDIEMHDRLRDSGHWSPFEHCAQAKQEMLELEWTSNFDSNGLWSGWLQYRKRFETENKTEVNLNEILASKPDWISL